MITVLAYNDVTYTIYFSYIFGIVAIILFGLFLILKWESTIQLHLLRLSLTFSMFALINELYRKEVIPQIGNISSLSFGLLSIVLIPIFYGFLMWRLNDM